MAIARVTTDVDGEQVTLDIGYEIVGEGRPWILTPGGGFFSRFYGGIRETAVALAELGNQVVIWDKPGTGESDLCFAGSSVSTMQADFLAGLLRHLGLAPAILIGGSAGSRVSTLATARHRDVVKGLAVWWLTGGVYGRVMVGQNFAGPAIDAAWNGGMEAVTKLPQWQENLERNPNSHAKLMAMDSKAFIAIMESWLMKFCPRENELIPELPDDISRQLDVPALVFRSGVSDAFHTRATTDKLAELLRAKYIDPPWPDTEWNDGTPPTLFRSWPKLAPILHEWANEVVG